MLNEDKILEKNLSVEGLWECDVDMNSAKKPVFDIGDYQINSSYYTIIDS